MIHVAPRMLRVARLRVPAPAPAARGRPRRSLGWGRGSRPCRAPRCASPSHPARWMAQHATQNMQQHTNIEHATRNVQRTDPALTLRDGTRCAAAVAHAHPRAPARTALSVYPRGARALFSSLGASGLGEYARRGRRAGPVAPMPCAWSGDGMGWWGMRWLQYRLGFELQQLRVAECRPDEDDAIVEVPKSHRE